MDEQKENHSVEEKQEELEERVENELISALNRKDKEAVLKLVEDSHPIDLAYALEEASDSDIVFLATILPDQQMAEIIEQADDELQVRIMKLFDLNKIIRIFQHMSKDDIVDILGDMPANRRKELVKLMKSSDQEVIRNLLGYGESTAGGIMTTEYISMRSSLTVSQALEKVKEIAPKTEEINILYVLNEKKQLVGTVSLRELLVAKNYDTLQDIMEDNVISVEPEADQEDVARLVSKYDLHAIPVVNKRKGMLGIITVDDIIDVIEEENTEDMLKMGGVSKEEDVDSTVLESVKLRLPWLLINLVTAFLASSVVSLFEDTISQVVALAAAMPIVAGMGGQRGHPDPGGGGPGHCPGGHQTPRQRTPDPPGHHRRLHQWPGERDHRRGSDRVDEPQSGPGAHHPGGHDLQPDDRSPGGVPGAGGPESHELRPGRGFQHLHHHFHRCMRVLHFPGPGQDVSAIFVTVISPLKKFFL